MKRFSFWRLLALLPLPAALLLRFAASKNPDAVERLFSQGVYPAIAAPVSRIMAVCPVPVVELLAIALIFFVLYSLWKRRFFRILAVLLAVAAVFFGGWGLNYLRLPLEQTLGLPVAASSRTELVALCEKLVDDTNENHATADKTAILPQVPAAMEAAARDWPIGQGTFAAPKRALSSPLLTRLMIEGITSPFTAEALVNGDIPAISLPYAACHEAAHVRGIAREDDANLIAYLACMASEDAFFRYSGSASALMHTLNALRKEDQSAYATCYARLSEPVRTDLLAHAAFWAPYENTPAADISSRTNDAYLHIASGGEQSTRSYGRVVDLLLALQRKDF